MAPVFEPPLGYRFGFRAVMFQGMKSGDEMVMTVRIIGCMDHHDCHLVWITFNFVLVEQLIQRKNHV